MGLGTKPTIFCGTGEDGVESNASFAMVNGRGRQNILEWLRQRNPSFKPTIIKVSFAKKSLNQHNIGPMLGIEATLPQYIPDGFNCTPNPQQDEYPVRYFFYGTLADPEILASVLGLSIDELPKLKLGSVQGGRLRTWGGRLRTWGGRYRALVDDFSDTACGRSTVVGCWCLIPSKEHEDALRHYETDKYEVVRCTIFCSCGRENLPGLTFRFAGKEEELDPETSACPWDTSKLKEVSTAADIYPPGSKRRTSYKHRQVYDMPWT